jgi:SAM-dependent methyltransferase
MADTRDYLAINRNLWTQSNREFTHDSARNSWLGESVTWGVWSIPEQAINVLPDVAGRDVIELGCGTAYVSAWMKKKGARKVVGVDITPAQLETARQLNDEFGFRIELIEANAEAVPLPDAGFDLVISEYGASIWCDPALWIAEAARLLRPGGELVFLRNSTIATLCMPNEGKVRTELQRPQRGMYRLEWDDDDPAVEFHPPTGEMFRILRDNNFELLDLIELYPPQGAKDHPFYDYMTARWASHWPAEEIWKARLR